jgi:plastocyanin
MERTRRNILKATAAGTLAAGLGMIAKEKMPEAVMAQGKSQESHGHQPIQGPLSSATVSFGQWLTNLNPPLDRRLNLPPAPTANQHLLTPHETTIQAGGSVNFIIAGLHNVAIYDHATRPSDIDTSLVIAMQGPPGLALINDPDRRIYRGPDPSLLTTLDRVEVVTFSKPGTYLVICGVLLHFLDDMFGYVRVLP